MPGVAILELDCRGSMAAKSPSLARLRESTIDAERCENVCTAAGSVKSSAGTPDAVNRLIKRIGKRASFGFHGAHSYAAPRLRVRTGECGARYARYSGLAWASVNSAYRALYRADADAAQGFLAR